MISAIIIYDPLGDPYHYGCDNELCINCRYDINSNACRLWRQLYNNSFKETIRNRFHNKCYLCNKPEGKRKLSVHHVNYDKSCLCGSACEFVPLCQSCHAKTNHNRKYYEDLIMCYLYPERYFMVDI